MLLPQLFQQAHAGLLYGAPWIIFLSQVGMCCNTPFPKGKGKHKDTGFGFPLTKLINGYQLKKKDNTSRIRRKQQRMVESCPGNGVISSHTPNPILARKGGKSRASNWPAGSDFRSRRERLSKPHCRVECERWPLELAKNWPNIGTGIWMYLVHTLF